MGNEKEFVRSISLIEPRSLCLGLLLGFFLALMTYISMSDPYVIPLQTVKYRVVSTYGVPTSPMVGHKMNSSRLGSENITEDQHEKNGNNRVVDKNYSTTSDSTQKEDIINPKQLGERTEEYAKPQRKPMCDFSNLRYDVCRMEGDVRIHGKSSSVVFVASNEMGNPEPKPNESWRLKTYPRKFDKTIMEKIMEVSVKLSTSMDAPHCTLYYNIPAIVFSVSGYIGNIYHAFSDTLIPLYITSRQFNGEVQLLVTNTHHWWKHKYRHILEKLTRYEIIDFDNDDQVRCYPHVMVGLESHDDIAIDPSRTPDGHSIADFTRFLRGAYSLDRDLPIKTGEHHEKKPRLVIIDRFRTRRLIDVEEVIQMAEGLGYEVLRAEPKFETEVAEFAHLINSCDVMMGVLGAGLTHIIFLPMNAVFIQVVPWGRLENIGKHDYGDPARNMKLQYMEYSISEEESTLTDLYPRDHPVFTDPMSFHRLGWTAMGKIYLVQQNVKLDLRRFRPVLLKALELLH